MPVLTGGFRFRNSMIFDAAQSVDTVRKWFDFNRRWAGPIVATSLPGDPIHVGHIRLLRESASLAQKRSGRLVVIVNGDGFLLRKKGYVFLPLAERMEIIEAIAGVDFVVPWDDGSQFVEGALLLLRPAYFTKGGDRSSPAQMAECELKACEEIGCQIVYGVGGSDKPQSSSWLIENLKKNLNDTAASSPQA